MKKILSLLLTTVILSSLCFAYSTSAFGGENYVMDFEDFKDIIEDLDDGDEISLFVDCPIEETVVIDAEDCTINITGGHIYGGYCTPLIEVNDDDVTLNLGGALIERAKGGDGAAIQVDGDDCIINNGRFKNCESNGYGGAIYVTNNDPGCTIKNCSFKECKAKKGGAICVDSDDCDIIDCNFELCFGIGSKVYTFEDSTDIIRCTWDGPDGYKNCNIISFSGSIFSRGNIWIIAGVLVLAIITVVVLSIRNKKKKG